MGAAVTLADAEGLAGLSMRRVAEALGVSPMSIYTYVPSKSQLVDLMFDQVLGDAPEPDERQVGWRAKLAFIARQRWRLAERRPWVLDLALHRLPWGPNLLRKFEALMAALDGIGLTDDEMQHVAEALQYYIIGALQSARNGRLLEGQSNPSDSAPIEASRPFLPRPLDANLFPTLTRMGEALEAREPCAASEEAVARFDFGLERLLDGLEVFIRDRQTPS